MKIPSERAAQYVGTLILTQMFPPHTLLKGGMGVKIRYGETGTRATRDIDLESRGADDFLMQTSARLTKGWGTLPPSRRALKKNAEAPRRIAFTGSIRSRRKASPEGIPEQYVLDPYQVTLNFMGIEWKTLKLEVTRPEVHEIDDAPCLREKTNTKDALFAERILRLGTFSPAEVVCREQQIAQKIHAVTLTGSDRMHDLVDLQIIWSRPVAGNDPLDMPHMADLRRRTFAFRKKHGWPPEFSPAEAMNDIYVRAREETGDDSLAPDVTSAGAWLRDAVTTIDEVEPGPG